MDSVYAKTISLEFRIRVFNVQLELFGMGDIAMTNQLLIGVWAFLTLNVLIIPVLVLMVTIRLMVSVYQSIDL